MARFYGEIGFAVNEEVRPGIFEDVIVEYKYRGDVIRYSRGIAQGASVNDDITLGNSIRIVADSYARGHISAMRYIKWQGVLWTIEEIEVVRPRLLLRLGGVYNGPTVGSP